MSLCKPGYNSSGQIYKDPRDARIAELEAEVARLKGALIEERVMSNNKQATSWWVVPAIVLSIAAWIVLIKWMVGES